ncbi:hypothetical protein D3C81_1580340 [compost metagenome]
MDVESGVGVDKRIQRQVFIQLIDFAAQLQAVFVPVEDHPTDTRIVFDQLEQITAVLREHQLETH